MKQRLLSFLITLLCTMTSASVFGYDVTYADENVSSFVFLDGSNGSETLADGAVLVRNYVYQDVYLDRYIESLLSLKNTSTSGGEYVSIELLVDTITEGSVMRICFPDSAIHVNTAGVHETLTGLVRAGETKYLDSRWFVDGYGYSKVTYRVKQYDFYGIADDGSPIVAFKQYGPSVTIIYDNEQTYYGSIKIDSLFYNLRNDTKTAEVTYRMYNAGIGYKYSGDIVIPETVTYNNKSYTVTSIGDGAFELNDSLTSVTIPHTVVNIGIYAFRDCKDIVSMRIPKSVRSIGSSIFYGCNNLAEIVVESGNLYYDSRDNSNAIIETATNALIAGCKQTTIPNTVTCIEEYSFSCLDGLISITIPEGVINIGDYAFENCVNLESVNLPNTLTSIGENSFAMCGKITTLPMPSNIEKIGNSAFYGCKTLSSLYIPQSVTQIGTSAFGWCVNLTEIDVEDTNLFYDSRGNCNAIIETSNHKMIATCKNTRIPSSVKIIGESAFSSSSWLESMDIPNGVISIEENAFSFCENLDSLAIPESVRIIHDYAFLGCSGLSKIVCHATTPPTLGEYVFEEAPIKEIRLYVPSASVNAYKGHEKWGFFNIVEIGDNDNPTDGINGVKKHGKKMINFFDLNGKRLSSPQRGLNIIRMDDGTVKKVRY